MHPVTKCDVNHMVGLNSITVLTLIIVKQSEGFTDILEQAIWKYKSNLSTSRVREYRADWLQCASQPSNKKRRKKKMFGWYVKLK